MNRTMINRIHTGRKGFTLIELLVVVLILAILMAVAMPLYLTAVSDSQTKTCRANMQTIANAVQSARVKAGTTSAAAYVGNVTVGLEPDLGVMPICPNGGTYSIVTPVGGDATLFKVSCTTAAHGTFQPGVDHN